MGRPRLIGYGSMQVFVRGKMGTAAEADIPPVRVKDCPPKAIATIEIGRDGTMMDRAWLTASVTSAGGEPFKTVEKTATPTVEHSYEGRPQNRLESYFFVKLEASRMFTAFRPAPTEADPIAEQRWLYHGAPHTVVIDRVTVKDMTAGIDGREHVAVTREADNACRSGRAEGRVLGGASEASTASSALTVRASGA